MSHSTRRNQQPMPPAGGWRPMEAADILCSAAAALYRQGGEALEVAMSNELPRLSARAKRNVDPRPDAWLTLQLLDAIRLRPDLLLAGRNSLASLAPRTAMELDVLQDACERNDDDHAIHRRWVHIDFRDNRLSSGHDVPQTHFNPAQPQHFADVRIEAASASPAHMEPPADAADTVGMPKFTPDRCKLWLLWRQQDWPEGKAPPSALECLAAARLHFSGHIARDEFYELRKKVVPPEWQKQGPRGPRNLPHRPLPKR